MRSDEVALTSDDLAFLWQAREQAMSRLDEAIKNPWPDAAKELEELKAKIANAKAETKTRAKKKGLNKSAPLQKLGEGSLTGPHTFNSMSKTGSNWDIGHEQTEESVSGESQPQPKPAPFG